MGRALVAFDFDHTVVEENSDVFIYNCLPNARLPLYVSQKYAKGRWLEFMNIVFDYLSEVEVTKEEIVTTMQQLELTPGMHVGGGGHAACKHAQELSRGQPWPPPETPQAPLLNPCTPSKCMQDLLTFLGAHPAAFDCVILSDANTFFIDTILESKGHRQMFKEVGHGAWPCCCSCWEAR